MTQLLEQAITQLKNLSDDEQNAIASRLLAEMADDVRWQSQFASTTNHQWDCIAEMVRQEIAISDVTPLAEAFDL